MPENIVKVTRSKSFIEIERALNFAFHGYNALNEKKRLKCVGGCFVIRNMITGEIALKLMIGGIYDTEIAKKYMRIAQEETLRIYETKHLSSWITRNHEEEKYGGGIHSRAYKLAMAFTGNGDEQCNEAISVSVASLLGLISDEEVEAITLISDNELAKKLIKSIAT